MPSPHPPTQPSQLPNAVPSGPGILFVLSTVLPSHPPLPAEAFATWYENTHIPEVQSTGGIASTQRYESISFASSVRGRTFGETVPPGNRGCAFEFATVYQMPDLAFRETEAFQGLDGQSVPRAELLEGLFAKVEFVTRFAGEEEVSDSGGGGEARRAAPFAVTIAPLARADGGSGEAMPELSGIAGVRRMVKYRVHEGSRLRRFERSWLDEPREMAIVELESEEGIAALAGVLAQREGLEVGFWGLRREYDGSERTPAVWSPPRHD